MLFASIIESNELEASYIPPKARIITSKEKNEWKIENDDLNIIYNNAESLLDAFEEDIRTRKDHASGTNYRFHVEHIWHTVDEKKVVLPQCALSNPILVEDRYHKPTFNQVRKGGVQASTLRVRFLCLRAFINFLRRRKVFGGITRSKMTSLMEYIEDWNSEFKEKISQRKTDKRKEKKRRLMTPSHMIKYGRSLHVRSIVKSLEKKKKCVPSKRFCQNVRDYLMTNICIMNGLRASNIIELRVKDFEEAEESADYPDYMTFTNSKYKTSTIYGEKVIVLPNRLFSHLKEYVERLRPVLSQTSTERLFVSNEKDVMTHGSINNALTSSFTKAGIFSAAEYQRVSPTRIRCACATFGCLVEGVDSAFFAKHFMKNKENTTNIHYNFYANHREALKLAMMMGDTFQVGGVERKASTKEIEELSSAIKDSEKNMPSKERVLKFMENVDMDNNEMTAISENLSELDARSTTKFYGTEKVIFSHM